MSFESRMKLSKAVTGISKSTEHKRKISESLKGRKIDPETIEKTASKLRGRKQPKIKCPHCSTEGAISVMKRWHFSNCKSL